MTRQFPNTPTFHPATAALPPGANHPATPHSPAGQHCAGHADEHHSAGHRGARHMRALREVADHELVAAVTAGDEDALAELIERHRRELWVIAYRYVRRDHVAHDVVATVLVQVWRRAAQFTGTSAVSTWLYRVTVNAAIDVLRREQVRAGDAPAPAAPTDEDLSIHALAAGSLPGDPATAMTDRDFVARLLAELPAEQRRAVELVDVDGHSIADTALALGCAEGTVKSRRSRAFRTLARRWTPDGDRRRK